MIAFTTLFLGLVLGPQTLEVAVSGDVVAVEFHLDGMLITKLEQPPWAAVYDLGDELAPRHLVALARGDDGRELARTEQWLNLPSAPAEVTVVLDRVTDDEGATEHAVRLSWESIAGGEPLAVRVEIDGQAIEVEDPRRFALPSLDPEALHFLRVEIELEDGIVATRELTFGGAGGTGVSTDLTAVPYVVEGRGGPQELDDFAGFLASEGTQLTPIALEKGPAEVLVVLDLAAFEELGALSHLAPYASGGELAAHVRRLGGLESLRGDQLVRILWPMASSRQGARNDFALFPESPTFRGPIFYRLLLGAPRPTGDFSRQRLADAVAVAGLTAASSKRRRTVLLILGSDSPDESRLRPEQARRYLERLRVPLHVWSLSSDGVPAGWGEADRTTSMNRFRKALSKMSRSLQEQRIVWVDGMHLPQSIALTTRAPESLRLLGGGPSILVAAENVVAAPAPGQMIPETVIPETVVPAPVPVAFERSDLERETIDVASGSVLMRQPSPRAEILAQVSTATQLPVIERRGGWVRLRAGSRLGWLALHEGAAPQLRELIATPRFDPEQLELALQHLSATRRTLRAGPFTLYTDYEQEERLADLVRLAEQLPEVFAASYGIAPDFKADDSLVLFKDAAGFNAYRETLGLSKEALGHLGEGFAVTWVGKRKERLLKLIWKQQLAGLMIPRALGGRVPDWLHGGMVRDMALTEIEPETGIDTSRLKQGQVMEVELFQRIGTLRIDPRSMASPDADPPIFCGYAIRYLLSEPAAAAKFRTFLRETAAGGSADDEVLISRLDLSLGGLEDALASGCDAGESSSY